MSVKENVEEDYDDSLEEHGKDKRVGLRVLIDEEGQVEGMHNQMGQYNWMMMMMVVVVI